MSQPLKSCPRTAKIAWSAAEAAPSLLALGSNPTNAASAIMGGGGASMDPSLDIVNFDPAKPAPDMDVMASIKTDGGRKFSCLAWGTAGTETGACPYGMVAGGLESGIVSLWNPAGVLKGDGSGLIHSVQVHNGAVNCLEFNPLKPNLMASCGADSEVKIISLDDPTNPKMFAPSNNPSTHVGSEVLCCAWNRKLQHILCSCSDKGSTVVWDLKMMKEVINFKDPANRSRCSAVAWHPDVPTQLLVAYDDDRHPSIQMWDLRNCQYPFKETAGHTKGILDVAWNSSDPNLILSCGKDSKVICWNIAGGSLDTFCEIPTQQGNTGVRWAPHRPGIIAAASMSGSVNVHSVQTQQNSGVKYCPKWYGKPGGVSFGFGAKMLSFGAKQAQEGKPPNASWCHSLVVPNEPEIVPTADAFEQWIAERKIKEFCRDKTTRSGGPAEHEGLMWELMGSRFEGDDRQRVPTLLGFDTDSITTEAEKYLGKRPGSTLLADPPPPEQQQQAPAAGQPETTNVSLGPALDLSQAESFFEELSNTTEQRRKEEEEAEQQQKELAAAIAMGATRTDGSNFGGSKGTDWSVGPEATIKKAMLIGNLAAAVECCFKAGKMAEGLLLASGGGTKLFQRARDEYLRLQDDTFLSAVGNIMKDEFQQLVVASNLSNWRETLAIIATYSQPADQDPHQTQYKSLCMQLAERLEKEKFDIRSAVICYICAGNFPKTVSIWSNTTAHAGSKNLALQDLVEKMTVFYEATGKNQADPEFNRKLTQYAEILANSGRLVAAMRTLCNITDDHSSAILRERIYNSAPMQMSQVLGQHRPPNFPFELMDVRIAYAPQVQQQPAAAPQAHHAAAAPKAHHGGMPSAPMGGAAPAAPGMAGMPRPAMPPAPNMGNMPRPGMNTGGYGQPNPPGGFAPQTQPSYGGAPGGMAPHQPPHQPPAAPGPGLPPRPQVSMPGAGGPGAYPPHTPAPAPAPHVAPQQPYHPTAAPMAGPGVLPPGGGMSPAAGQPGMSPSAGQPGGRPSTAPQASAMPVVDNMPTPWPLPTKTQQKLSTTTTVAAANQAVQDQSMGAAAAGEPMPPHELQHVRGTLSTLLDVLAGQDPNPKKREDIAKRLEELYGKLQAGQIKTATSQKVLALVKAVEAQDHAASSRIQQELYQTDWDINKSWLMGLKRLFAGR